MWGSHMFENAIFGNGYQADLKHFWPSQMPNLGKLGAKVGPSFFV